MEAVMRLKGNEKPFTREESILIATLPETEMRTYLVLRGHCWGNRVVCWPKVATIAEMIGKSSRTVQRAVKSLVDKGVVERVFRKITKTMNESNLYVLRPLIGRAAEKLKTTKPLMKWIRQRSRTVWGQQREELNAAARVTPNRDGDVTQKPLRGVYRQEKKPRRGTFSIGAGWIDTGPVETSAQLERW